MIETKSKRIILNCEHENHAQVFRVDQDYNTKHDLTVETHTCQKCGYIQVIHIRGASMLFVGQD